MTTPLEIENKRFSKQIMNGYNVDDVDSFLDDITEDYAKLYKDISEYKSKIDEMSKDVEKYKTIENTLQSTLIMAQSTSEEIKNVANQKAEQIISEAKVNAEKQVMQLDNQIVLKQKELESVKKQFDVYKAKMESLLISQLELLKDVNGEEEIF